MNVEVPVCGCGMRHGKVPSLKVVASATLGVALRTVLADGFVNSLDSLVHRDAHAGSVGNHEAGDRVFLPFVVLLMADQTIDVLDVLQLGEHRVVWPPSKADMTGRAVPIAYDIAAITVDRGLELSLHGNPAGDGWPIG